MRNIIHKTDTEKHDAPENHELPKPLDTPERAMFPTLGTTLSPYGQTGLGARSMMHGPKPTLWQRIRSLNRKKLAKRVGIGLAVLVLIAGLYTGYKFFQNAHKLFGGNILGLLTTQKLRGEDTGRVNILLTGYSADDPGHGGATLTDSIMVVSLDVQNNTGFMLSIPRDLWVQIPNYDHQKINAAYEYGNANKFSATGYPKGGIGQLEQIISQDFGITINYYALINYTALKQAVNAVGGIDVTIKSIDSRGLYDPNISYADGGPLKLSNGVQHLNGQTALNLARARGDSYYSYGFPQSDFNRTENQRMMLLALKQKILSTGTLSNPLKLGQLFDSLGNNVQTDFKASEIRRLYDVTKKINDTSIKSISLNNVDGKGKNLLASYRSPGGQSALIPAAGYDDFSDIQTYVHELLNNDTSTNTTDTTKKTTSSSAI